MHRKVAGTLLAAVAGIALVGCGGSDSTHVTRSAFARQVDAICTRYEHQGLALGKAALTRAKGQGGVTPALQDEVWAKMAVYRTRTLAALKKIEPPTNLQAAYTQWQSAFPPAESRKLANASETSPAHIALRALGRKRLRLAAKLGITACR